MSTRLQLRDSVQYTPVHFFPLQDYVIRQVYKDRKRKENGETIRKRIIFQPVSSYNRLIESFATRVKGHNQLEVKQFKILI